jgi:hypothetical protein
MAAQRNKQRLESAAVSRLSSIVTVALIATCLVQSPATAILPEELVEELNNAQTYDELVLDVPFSFQLRDPKNYLSGGQTGGPAASSLELLAQDLGQLVECSGIMHIQAAYRKPLLRTTQEAGLRVTVDCPEVPARITASAEISDAGVVPTATAVSSAQRVSTSNSRTAGAMPIVTQEVDVLRTADDVHGVGSWLSWTYRVDVHLPSGLLGSACGMADAQQGLTAIRYTPDETCPDSLTTADPRPSRRHAHAVRE